MARILEKFVLRPCDTWPGLTYYTLHTEHAQLVESAWVRRIAKQISRDDSSKRHDGEVCEIM